MTEAEIAPEAGTRKSDSSIGAPSASLRGFWALMATQFQGAFSDNVLKNLVVFLMLGAGLSLADKHRLGELVGALFALPFILFSMAGGFLADRHCKRTIMIGVKVFEIFVMLFALAGLIFHHLPTLLAGVFLMGTHSAFFGPSKYGSLPELLPEKKLSWGNGLLELGTFTAIILGTVAAALMAEHLRGRQGWSGAVLVALALVGLITSLGITRVPAADPAKKFKVNFVGDLLARLRAMRGDRPLVLAVIGNTYFNFLGALLLLNLFFYGADVLGVSETKIGLLNVALALGIGLGSVSAGYLSGNKIEYGLVPIGALGLALSCASLSLPGVTVNGALVRLALLGFAGGFFIVPVCALLQHRPDKTEKGEVLAAANLLSFVGVFLASAAHFALTQWAGLSPLHIFLVGGGLTLAGGFYAVWLLPDSLLRFLLWVATHSLYRVRVLGRDNIPAKGGALFVCNHLSLADAVLLQSSTDRPIRFIMLKAMYERPIIKTCARIMQAIPISSELRPREMIKSLQTASDAIRNGEVVCIFAEGQITRIGQMMPFRRGFERIMKEVHAPIIPVGLDGIWGSIFSFEGHKFLWKMPRRIPYPITINFGPAMPPTASPFEVRQTVQELLAEAWLERKKRMRPLHHSFVVSARRRPHRLAMADAQTPALTFHSALTRSIFLARRLKTIWAGQRMVGLLLPPSVGGALANWAALFCGKVPVNLNYTLAEESLASCARQCELKTVLTSRAFLEKVKLKLPGEVVFLEDVLQPAPSVGEKLTALFIARFLPVAWVERVLNDQPAVAGNPLDQLATVIFSSGSTGEPKGVMLSHYNVGSNLSQLGQTFAFGGRDRILGVLPFFHSFGFTGTLALPAVLGIGVVYHTNPLDAKTIGPLVADYGVTFLLATPTFLQLYMRGCTAEQFGSVRLVAVSAEKLPERLATAFEEQFGIRPFEAYGCTECSPGVTVNTHDFRAAGFRQVGAKRGKIGHPLPGICVKIVDPAHPDPDAPLPLGQAGLLLVRGPNVMLGYLGQPEKTAEVLRDGWYTTGDIAALDEDGFLQITDRLSRFSKLGGEMVPHIKVEEKLHEFAGATEQTFVVIGVPDEKKGERLVVLHRLADEELRTALEKLTASDLPNLWKPKADSFVRVEAFPLLGSGKLNLRKVKEIAAEKSKAADTVP
jgi:acyl-[acyl-carrier-protein]-phospholipid O-acyltransferase / long-chain-fatty-acid--[acyl-carrier-protein] ligase